MVSWFLTIIGLLKVTYCKVHHFTCNLEIDYWLFANRSSKMYIFHNKVVFPHQIWGCKERIYT